MWYHVWDEPLFTLILKSIFNFGTSKGFRLQYNVIMGKIPLDLNFKSNHPMSVKCTVVRALIDRENNVCSSVEILTEEMDHLGKELNYDNFPKFSQLSLFPVFFHDAHIAG